MKLFARLSLSLFAILIIGLLGYSAYLFKPETKNVQTCAYVSEYMVRTVQYPITLDGKKGFIEMGVPYRVSKPVYETRIVEPSAKEKLVFWVLSGAAVLLGGFYLSIMCIWLYYQARDKESPRGIERNLAAALVYAGGIVTGILVNQNYEKPTPTIPATAQSEESSYEPFPQPGPAQVCQQGKK